MSMIFDEYGRPFIILREQQAQARIRGKEAQKVRTFKPPAQKLAVGWWRLVFCGPPAPALIRRRTANAAPVDLYRRTRTPVRYAATLFQQRLTTEKEKIRFENQNSPFGQGLVKDPKISVRIRSPSRAPFVFCPVSCLR